MVGLAFAVLTHPSISLVKIGGKVWLGSGYVFSEDAAELVVWPPGGLRCPSGPTVGGSRFDTVGAQWLSPSLVKTGFHRGPAAARKPCLGC